MAAKESKVCDETLQVLKKQLKCQVCKSGPRPDKVSRYNCLYGHVICQDCESKMDPELWTLLLNSMQVKCINKSKGCNEVLNKEAMILHEPECIQNYRLVACPRDHESMLKMPFHKLLHHLKKEHSLGYRHFKKLSFNEKLIQNIPFKDGAYYSTMWLYYSTVMIKIDGNFFIHSMREICTKDPQNVNPPKYYGKAQIYPQNWHKFINGFISSGLQKKLRITLTLWNTTATMTLPVLLQDKSFPLMKIMSRLFLTTTVSNALRLTLLNSHLNLSKISRSSTRS